MPKPDFSDALASAGGGTRRRKEEDKPKAGPVPQHHSRIGTRPITAHFPKEVRDQIKIMAIENDTTLHKLIAEAFNDLFAKYGKPEIAPVDGNEK